MGPRCGTPRRAWLSAKPFLLGPTPPPPSTRRVPVCHQVGGESVDVGSRSEAGRWQVGGESVNVGSKSVASRQKITEPVPVESDRSRKQVGECRKQVGGKSVESRKQVGGGSVEGRWRIGREASGIERPRPLPRNGLATRRNHLATRRSPAGRGWKNLQPARNHLARGEGLPCNMGHCGTKRPAKPTRRPRPRAQPA